jgi:glutamate synthase (NADPH/NADH) small chain
MEGSGLLEYLKRERSQDWRVELRSNLKTKERTQMERLHMPEQDPDQRNKNFTEVNLGLTEEQAIHEARRCIDCPNPTCITGCPVGINIPKFIKKIEAGEFLDAAKVLKETNALPAVCGRVCPQETQCEQVCYYPQKLQKLPVAIGNLERFAADYERNSGKISVPEKTAHNGIKVASVGSGPAGLAFAGDMAKMGYDVTVFEALHEIGGVLKYGIPEFRLPNEIVDVEIDILKQMGVKFVHNFIVGKTASIKDLAKEGFTAFMVGSGAGLPNFMNIPGENLIGIYSSNEYLTRINLMKAARPDYDTPVISGKSVAVIGGGNTAMDSVRTAKRLGAERAMIIYRRSIEEMPARDEEIKHAQEEGIEFLNLNNPIEYYGDDNGRVRQMKIQKMELGEPDSSGRRRPIPIEGSEYFIDVDTVVVSVGVSPNPLIPQSIKELDVSAWGTINVNKESMQSSIPDIFAGGDIVRGGATVILAMGDGRRAAAAMDRYIKQKVRNIISLIKEFKTIGEILEFAG